MKIVLAAIAAAAMSTAADAATTTFTDRAAFDAAISGAPNIIPEPLYGSTIINERQISVASGFTSDFDGSLEDDQLRHALNNNRLFVLVDGDGDISGDGGSSATWTLPENTFAFGFDFVFGAFGFDEDLDLAQIFIETSRGEEAFSLSDFDASLAFDFAGFVSDTAIRSVRLASAGGRGAQGITFEDFTFATEAPAPVPLPAALPLLAGSIGLVGVFGRRRARR
ncbi:hypothetical protein HKCCE2091_13865 [Rhodobacterales bacterium HKCCE2091]|nr:hypothetical protein [Rhodobacterales bacterium HKCCE2091]